MSRLLVALLAIAFLVGAASVRGNDASTSAQDRVRAKANADACRARSQVAPGLKHPIGCIPSKAPPDESRSEQERKYAGVSKEAWAKMTAADKDIAVAKKRNEAVGNGNPEKPSPKDKN